MITSETELYGLMAQKLETLQNICNNTMVQIRFIQQRKLKGLHRLLDERAWYLQDLKALNDEINHIADHEKENWTSGEQYKQIELAIQGKEREIVSANDEALKAGRAERDNIIADLWNVRSQKSVKRCYKDRWINRSGKRLNRQV